MSSQALPPWCTTPPTKVHTHTHTNFLTSITSAGIIIESNNSYRNIRNRIILLQSQCSLPLSESERRVKEVSSPRDVFFHIPIIHFTVKHNSTKSGSNQLTTNWLIAHSQSIVACIQLISAESWKTFFMLSCIYNMACCFPILHHTFSQFEIDSSRSRRERGRREQNFVVEVWEQYMPSKVDVYYSEVTVLSSSLIWVCFRGLTTTVEELIHHLQRRRAKKHASIDSDIMKSNSTQI